MAKKSTETTSAPAAAAPTAEFRIEAFGPPPARTVGGATAGKPPSKYTPYLEAMSAPNVAEGKYHSFFVPVTLEGTAANLQGDEQKKALKDAARKTQNAISSVTRRLIKADATRSYPMRVVEENGVTGVRVWRGIAEPKKQVPAPAAPAAAAPAAPAAAPAVPAPVAAAPAVPQVPSL